MWSGYEPSEGQFNATYLQQQQAVVDMLARHGIYSLLDMHQDAMRFDGHRICSPSPTTSRSLQPICNAQHPSSKFCTYGLYTVLCIDAEEFTSDPPPPTTTAQTRRIPAVACRAL